MGPWPQIPAESLRGFAVFLLARTITGACRVTLLLPPLSLDPANYRQVMNTLAFFAFSAKSAGSSLSPGVPVS